MHSFRHVELGLLIRCLRGNFDKLAAITGLHWNYTVEALGLYAIIKTMERTGSALREEKRRWPRLDSEKLKELKVMKRKGRNGQKRVRRNSREEKRKPRA